MMNHHPNGRARLRLTIFPLLLLLAMSGMPCPACCSSFFAQQRQAMLGGRVVDDRNAVLRSATLVLLNRDKTLERQVTTDEYGGFMFLLLPPGDYILRAQCAGFTPVEIHSLPLVDGDARTIVIRMRIGGISASINVQAQPDNSPNNFEGTTARASDISNGGLNLNRERIENLPFAGRSFLSLLTIAPGVVLTRATADEQGQFSATGQRANANHFMLDGVSANSGITATKSLGQAGAGALPSLGATGSTGSLVSIEALQEVRVQTSAYAAEFGRMPGAQISMVTRSGANDLHGSLFHFFRNDALDANDWFANRAGLKKAALRQNDFGGVFGGTVRLPGYDGRDRTFFFLSSESLRLRQPLFGAQLVPSIKTRQKGSAAIRAILNAYPLPNGAELGEGLAEFSAAYSDPTRLDAIGIRLDHTINSRQTLFVRFHHAPSQTSQRIGSLSRSLATEFNHQSVTVGALQSLTPRLNNDLRLNFTRSRGTGVSTLDDFGGANPPDEKLLFPVFATSQDSLLSVFALGLEPFSLGKSVDNRQSQFNLVDQLSFDANSHHLKLGVDLRLLAPVSNPGRYEQILNFWGVTGADGFQPPTGTLLSERASSVQIISRDAMKLSFTNFSAFVQDGWRITPRLNLNFGVRWEFNPPPSAKSDQPLYTLSDFKNLATTTLVPHYGELWRTVYGNFAPRVGVAYQFNSKQHWQTMLRGGFGLFYDLGAGNIAANASSFPYVRNRFMFDPSGIAIPLSALRAEPLPFGAEPPYGSLEVFDPQMKLPGTARWSFAVQQSLGVQQTLVASYVGATGYSLLRREALYSFNPNFGAPLYLTRNAATSDYHALQIQWQQRLNRFWQMLASYAWSHSIDLASNDSMPLTSAERLDPKLDRGASDFDVRHQLSAVGSFELPAIKMGMFGRRFLRGWVMDSIFRAQTATPIDVSFERDIGFGFFNTRPDVISGVSVFVEDANAPGGRKINPASFFKPKENRQGSLGRNALRGFPFWQVDFALRRQFEVTNRIKLQFRAEFFNLFNHSNFGNPRASLNDPLFGQSSSLLNRGLGSGGASGGLNPVFQIGGPRSVQLSLRLAF